MGKESTMTIQNHATTDEKMSAMQATALDAMRSMGVDRQQRLRMILEHPQDTREGRFNQGWFDGVEAARQAFRYGDYRAFTLGFLGTEQYQEAFRSAVQAYND